MKILAPRQKFNFAVPILLGLLIGGGLFFWHRHNQSEAADARQFDAANIMSDSVMSNKATMSEEQIQNFLKSKNGCNNRNVGEAAKYPNVSYNIKDGHFVCMADDSFGGESAAHIIWQAAQDYNINPQVLIVLLEKEQGLVTDTWPNSIQYRSATGYGCPDTAACDSQYYGLKNQIRNAARFFHAYQINQDGWYKPYWTGNHSIYWNPDHNNCGASNVNIANRATASLYSYTPYRPNQAALNAQYGTGDGCSAYGNRNFWLYFNDWFGSTQAKPQFTAFADPRYMELNKDSQKYNATTGQPEGPAFSSGLQRKFVSKIALPGGETCYRTEVDHSGDTPLCFPSSSIKEVSFVYEDVPYSQQTMQVSSEYTYKYDIRRETWSYGPLYNSRQLTVTKKTTLNGLDYYISVVDAENGNLETGVRGDRLISSASFISINPVMLRLTTDSDKINLGTRNKVQALPNGLVRTYRSKTQVDGKWHYRTESDEVNNLAYAIPETDLTNQLFENFILPREMRLSRWACKIDPISETIGDCFDQGLTRKFTRKIYTSGEWFYQTESDAQNNYYWTFRANAL